MKGWYFSMIKETLTIAEIHEDLNDMHFPVTLELLAQMTPSELRKLHKLATKAYKLTLRVDQKLDEIDERLAEANSNPIDILAEKS